MSTQASNCDPVAPLHIITQHDAVTFIKSKPSREIVYQKQREELVLIAQELKVETEGIGVAELKDVICQYLCDEGGARGGDLETRSNLSDGVIPNVNMTDNEMAKRDHEIRLLQLQLQFQKEETERQLRLKAMELESQRTEWESKKELEKYRIDHVPQVRPPDHNINGFEAYRLVPKFDEDHVAEFFQRFEKLAKGNGWPEHKWSTLAQSVFTGKALKAFDALSAEEALNYEVLKSTVLRMYELRPEAYRLKFRNSRKRPHESHLEFVKYNRDLFRAWQRSERVENDFNKLEELLLMEHFLSKLEPDVKLYLCDKKLKTVEEAAVYADDYFLLRGQPKIKYHSKENSKPTSPASTGDNATNSSSTKPASNKSSPSTAESRSD